MVAAIKVPLRRPLTLSIRQQQVLIGHWIGETVKQTSDRIGVTEATVKKYRETARMKLHAPTIMIAVKRAINKKLIQGPGIPKHGLYR
jgi:DNA-binding NarL/FixJ family response regulator